MSASQNGWPIKPASQTDLIVGGVNFGGVRSGSVFTVLAYVATRFHHEVEPLRAGQCGAYNPRKIPGSDVWSNHASATAIDCNWQLHPLGARGTYSYRAHQTIERIVADCDGVVRWGGTYSTTVDEMHFEINKGATAVAALAKKINEQQGDDMDQATFNKLMDNWVSTKPAATYRNGILSVDLGAAGGSTFAQAVQNTEITSRETLEAVQALTPPATPPAPAPAVKK